MFDRNTVEAAEEETLPMGRIRVKAGGVEAFSAPGGSVRLGDETGRQIALVFLPPQSTRFLSVKGLERGTYKVELKCVTGMVATALIEA